MNVTVIQDIQHFLLSLPEQEWVSMAFSQEPQKTDDILQCPICLEQYEVPRALPCLHTFCEKCLVDWVKHKSVSSTLTIGSVRSFPCPVCKDDASLPPEGIKGFRHNFYVASLVNSNTSPVNKAAPKETQIQQDIDNDKTCHRCEERGVAKICIKCNFWLCTLCCDDHKRVKDTKGHILAGYNELLEAGLVVDISVDDVSECSNHGKCNELLCIPCKILMCADCQATQHESHQNINIVCKLNEVRSQLLDSLGRIQKRDELLKSQYTVASHARKDLVSRGHKVIRECDKEMAIIEKKLQELKSRMQKDIKKQIAGQIKILDERMVALNDKIIIGESVQEEIKNILESGSNKDILTQANMFCNQADDWMANQIVHTENMLTLTTPVYKHCDADIFDQLLTKLAGSFSCSGVEINLNKPLSKSKRSKKKRGASPSIVKRISQQATVSEDGQTRQLSDIIRDFDPLGEDASSSRQSPEILVDTSVPDEEAQEVQNQQTSTYSNIIQEHHDTESPVSDIDSDPTADNPPESSGSPQPPTGPFYSTEEETPTDSSVQYWWSPPHHDGPTFHPPRSPGHGPPPPHWHSSPLHRFHPPPPPGPGHPPPGFPGHRGQGGRHGRHGRRGHPPCHH